MLTGHGNSGAEKETKTPAYFNGNVNAAGQLYDGQSRGKNSLEIQLSRELYDQIKREIKQQIVAATGFSDATGDIEIRELAVNFEATFQSVLLPISPRSEKDAPANTQAEEHSH